MLEWVDLSSCWEDLRKVADARDEQKKGFSSSTYWNSDSHFIGLLGEYIYGKKTHQPVNLKLLIRGDGGSDFPDTDVKSCTYWKYPWLKYPVKTPLLVSKYVLVAIDVPGRRGYIVGYATKEELSKAPIRDWGRGPQRSICYTKLHPLI